MPASTTSHLIDATSTATAAPVIHVGVLLPWANQVVEAELPRLCPPSVVCHYARLVPSSRRTALDHGFLEGLRAEVPTAMESLSQLPLAGVLLACTSAGFTCPRLISPHPSGAQGRPGVLSAFDALIDTLRRLGADRIALTTPYPDAVTRLEAEAFTARGITVTGQVSLGRDDDYPDITGEQLDALLARLPPDALRRADALVLSCTGWPTLAHVPRFERDLGIPVVSSNLAMAAHAAALLPGEVPR